MTDDDKTRFALAIASLAEVFDKSLSSNVIKAYFEALHGFDIEQVERSVVIAKRMCQFFPRPANLIEFIIGDPQDRAAIAWARFTKALDYVGTYQSVNFNDPVLHAVVVGMGGWQEMWRLSRLDDNELGYKRAEFMKLYTAISKKPSLEAPARLIGQSEAYNVARGHFGHDPVISIGEGGTPEVKRELQSKGEQKALLEGASDGNVGS